MAFFSKLKLCNLWNTFLTQMFFLDTKRTWQVLLSLHSFKPRKNIPVLVGSTYRKPEYLDMRTTYAQ